MPAIHSTTVSPHPRRAAPALFEVPKQGQWVQNPKGKKSDPVNLYVHGSLDDVRRAFKKAGWVEPTPKSTKSMLAYGGAAAVEIATRAGDKVLAKAVDVFGDVTHLRFGAPKLPHLTKGTVERMPIAHLYMNGKPDVVSFEKGNDPTGGRHHFRVFDTGRVDSRGEKVWAIAASLDNDTVLALHKPEHFFINHTVDPNADLERDEVMRDLRRAGLVGSVTEHKLPFGSSAPSGLNTKDGRVFDVVLR